MEAVEITLNRGMVALVDADDFERASARKWFAVNPGGRRWYAMAHNPRKVGGCTYLHRLVMDAKRGQIIDHIDRDGLNCTKGNLRFATNSQNLMNTLGRVAGRKSPYKGVVFHGQIGRWRARIKLDGKQISLGCFATPEEAAKAYSDAASHYFGEFAPIDTHPTMERARAAVDGIAQAVTQKGKEQIQ